jgi:DNA-directed RNA polymerase alpha subunit
MIEYFIKLNAQVLTMLINYLEKLVFNIKTDGSIHPKEALKEAAKILIHHFMLFSDERITLDSEIKAESEEFDETSLHMRQLLKTKLVDMDLSVRALNCLKAADVETLGDLVSYAKSDLESSSTSAQEEDGRLRRNRQDHYESRCPLETLQSKYDNHFKKLRR